MKIEEDQKKIKTIYSEKHILSINNKYKESLINTHGIKNDLWVKLKNYAKLKSMLKVLLNKKVAFSKISIG